MNSYSGQNVAHVKPMPNLAQAKSSTSTLSSPNSPERELLRNDPSKNPKQLYQMVSVNVNGVVKNLMVPVSSPSSSSKTVTTPTASKPEGLHGISSIAVTASSSLASSRAHLQSVLAKPPQNVSSQPAIQPKAPTVYSKPPPGQLQLTSQDQGVVPKQARQSPVTAKLIQQPDGRMLLAGVPGIPTGSQLIIVPQQNNSGSTGAKAAVVVQTPPTRITGAANLSLSMPRLSAAPVGTTSVPVQSNIQKPSTGTNFTSTIGPAATETVRGYLVGNRLVIGQPPVPRPNFQPTGPSVVPQSVPVVTATQQSTYDHVPQSEGSSLKIDSVYSLDENIKAEPCRKPEVIEIIPDEEDDPEGTVLRLAKQADAINRSASYTTSAPAGKDTVSAVSVLPNAITQYNPASDSHFNISQRAIVSSKVVTGASPMISLLHSNKVQNLSAAVAPSAKKLVTVINSSSSQFRNQIVSVESPPTSASAVRDELRKSPVGFMPPRLSPEYVPCETKETVTKKQTARKSTTLNGPRTSKKHPFPFVIKPPMKTKLVTVTCDRKLRKYWPMLKDCSVDLPRIDTLFTKVGVPMKSQEHSTSHFDQSLLRSYLDKGNSPFSLKANPKGHSKIFKSQGRNLVVTPTGNKTIIQPSGIGPEKGKFLMIKTNAGTFLVPVNPTTGDPCETEMEKAGLSVQAASSFKVLPSVDTETKGKLTRAGHLDLGLDSPRGARRFKVLPPVDTEMNEKLTGAAHLDLGLDSPRGSKSLGTYFHDSNTSFTSASTVKRKHTDDDSAIDEAAPVKQKPESAKDRIKRLKEQLRKQKEEAEKASETISVTKSVLETIDLV